MVQARKIGLTSKVMQDAVGITEPDHGVIYADMFYGHGDTIPFDRFIAPRLEVELAFVLGARPERARAARSTTVLDATEYVTPAIEILDARIQMTDPDTGTTRTIVDTISDNAADAGIVVGAQRFGPRDARPAVGGGGAAPQRRDRGVGGGGGGARPSRPPGWRGWPTGSPRRGVTLRAGELILAGSFTRPIWVRRGDEYVADYGPLGTIEFRFA